MTRKEWLQAWRTIRELLDAPCDERVEEEISSMPVPLACAMARRRQDPLIRARETRDQRRPSLDALERLLF